MSASTADPVSKYAEALAGDWERELARDEGHFARLREQIVDGLSADEAFDAIGRVSTRLLEQSEADLRWAWSSLLLSLARRSNTTEMPVTLSENWQSIIESAGDDPSLASQLTEWYRTPTI